MELDNAASKISKCKELINQYIITALEEHGVVGIVTSHGEIILSLMRRDCLTMSELAALIRKDPSTVTTLVKKLHTFGYVTLTKCDNDKRSVRVSLTDKGKALESAFMQISNDLRMQMYKGVNADDKQVFKQVLHEIMQNLS
jgi:MarR family transcriptional regulator, organic hydroperoxide resistance regulator